MTAVRELILRTIVVQFDGTVVEVFGAPVGETVRHHVALLAEPSVGEPTRRGRVPVSIGRAELSIDPDEMARLLPLLDEIRAAIRSARTAG
jgi:hypothetical protein